MTEAAKAWSSEIAKEFPASRTVTVPDHTLNSKTIFGRYEIQWASVGAWQYCHKCGRRKATRSMLPRWSIGDKNSVHHSCTSCDATAVDLAHRAEDQGSRKLSMYCQVNPDLWQLSLTDGHNIDLWTLDDMEKESLSIVHLLCDYKSIRGGHAPVKNIHKLSVIRAQWKKVDVERNLPTEKAKVVFAALMRQNYIYALYIRSHTWVLSDNKGKAHCDWIWIPTAELLLRSPGIEVAARPWL